MKFWDASAIIPLLMMEPATKTMQALAEKDHREEDGHLWS